MQLSKLLQLQINPVTGEVARWADRLISLLDINRYPKPDYADPFPVIREVALERAYELAAYVLGNRALAKRVAVDVVDTLEVPYSIRRDAGGEVPKMGNKVWEPGILLDKVIYKKMNAHERQQEYECRRGKCVLDEEAMVIRYIKAIIEFSLDHTSLYVATGLFRVLFNYDVRDVRSIYRLLVPGPEDTPKSYDFRDRKQRYMRFLEKRFRWCAEVEECGDQHERRFKKQPDSGRFYGLVEQALDLMKPSLPSCATLPERFTDKDEMRRSLDSETSIPRNEVDHLLERNRMHMLIHQACVRRFWGVLALPPLCEALEVPIFSVSGGGVYGSRSNGSGAVGGPPSFDRRNIPALTDEEKEKMLAELDHKRKLRRGAAPDEVVIVADEVELATIRLNKLEPVRMRLDEGASILEFRSGEAEGGMRLGFHSLCWDPDTVPRTPESYRMMMENGRELKFSISYERNGGELTGATVVCSYSEERKPHAVSQVLWQIKEGLSQLEATVPALARSIAARLYTGNSRRSPARTEAIDCPLGLCSRSRFLVPDKRPLLRPLVIGGTAFFLTLSFCAGLLAGMDARMGDSDRAQVKAGREQLTHLGVGAPAIRLNIQPAAQDNHAVSGDAHAQTGSSTQVAARAGAQNARKTMAYNEVVNVKDSLDMAVIESSGDDARLSVLSSGMSRTVVNDGQDGALKPRASVVSVRVSKSYVGLSDLEQPEVGSEIVKQSGLLEAKRLYLVISGEEASHVAANIKREMALTDYVFTTSPISAEALMEVRVVRRASVMTVDAVLNSPDGSSMWLKSFSSAGNPDSLDRRVSTLSSEVVKSLTSEKESNLYVAYDHYATQVKARATSQQGPLPSGKVDSTLSYGSRGTDKGEGVEAVNSPFATGAVSGSAVSSTVERSDDAQERVGRVGEEQH